MPTLPFAVIPIALGTVTSGNERATNLASHLGELDTIGMTWKSTGNANLWARGNFASAKPVDFASVLRANALPGTTIRIRLGATQAEVDAEPLVIANQANTTVTSLGAGVYRAEKTAGAAATYDASAVSSTGIAGDFVLRIRALQTDKSMFIGIDAAPTVSNDHLTIDRSINFNSAGEIRGYENGTLVAGPLSYTTADYFFLQRVGTAITMSRGTGPTIATATATWTFTADASTFFFDSSIADTNGAVEVKMIAGAGTSYDSGALAFISPSITRDDALYSSHLELSTAQTTTWWRIDIAGHTGDFEAAMLILGKKVTPTTYYNPGWEMGVHDLGDIEIGRYGVPDETPGKIFRTLSFRFGWLSETDYETKWRGLAETLGKRRTALWCFDPTANVYRQSRSYYGWVRNPLVATHVANTPDGPRFQKDFEILSMI